MTDQLFRFATATPVELPPSSPDQFVEPGVRLRAPVDQHQPDDTLGTVFEPPIELGTMSQSIAMSSMNQLVGQLQPVMGGLIQCGCIGGGGIGSMFNDVFGQLTQVVQGLQTSFPGAGFNSLMMPFGQMLPTMQSFVSSYSQNSAFTSYAQTLNPFVNLIGGAVPGFGGLSTGL
ncbi:hypothetical protein H4Q26_008009 [Puccinia striiformis f. sp. tritici PST-130]|nr:hypothetical protein H4Q26_008009 [Puccinia striiformis f. sp. tritici PST-130]